MRVNNWPGLLLLVIIAVCCSSYALADDEDQNVNDDEYYDEIANNTMPTDPGTVTLMASKSVENLTDSPQFATEAEAATTESATTISTSTSSTTIEQPQTTTSSSDICSMGCRCTEALVNCSRAGLTEIPAPLPSGMKRLDCSHNEIAVLESASFVNATDLEYVDLSGNRIRHIDANAFADAPHLQELVLSNNPLQLEGELLVAPQLRKLHLDGCNISHFPSETFRHLPALQDLNLRGNAFDDSLNVDAFANMDELLRLQVDDVPERHSKALCNAMSKIDAIKAPNYLLSCVVLLNEETFEKSTYTPAPPATPHVEQTTVRLSSTTPVPTTTANARNSFAVNETQLNGEVEPRNNSSASNTILTVQPIADASNTIRYVLIASIAVAVLALSVGVCFRIDVLGVKTKLCRTRNGTARGPSPTDRVRPAEREPLKDIELKEVTSVKRIEELSPMAPNSTSR